MGSNPSFTQRLLDSVSPSAKWGKTTYPQGCPGDYIILRETSCVKHITLPGTSNC